MAALGSPALQDDLPLPLLYQRGEAVLRALNASAPVTQARHSSVALRAQAHLLPRRRRQPAAPQRCA